MIDALQRLVTKLGVLRPAFAVTGVGAATVAAFELFDPARIAGDYLLLALILVLWALIGFSTIGMFQHVPPAAESSDGFLARLQRRFTRSFYYLIAIIFCALSLAALYTSVRLIRLESA